MGMRRVGKTYFLYQTIDDLLQTGVSPKQILYINFEDDRLLPMSQQALAELLESFYRLFPENHDRPCYFFLDEIQNVEDWPLVIRRFFDKKRVDIYLTGSSSKLLSREIASSLRGRSIATEIWPYSFREYLRAKKIAIPENITSRDSQDHLQYQLAHYLEHGGFPEVVHTDPINAQQILQDYVDVVAYRDIIERYQVSNISLLQYLMKTRIKNTATAFSSNKFYNDSKSQGFTVGKNTIYDYVNHLEEVYLSFQVPLYSESLRQTNVNPKKIYAIDTGLVNAYSVDQQRNMGRLFENLVYLDLRRQASTVYYALTKDRYEVDFVAQRPGQALMLYQVAWDVSHRDTLHREMRALESAKASLGLDGELITPERYLQWQLATD